MSKIVIVFFSKTMEVIKKPGHKQYAGATLGPSEGASSNDEEQLLPGRFYCLLSKALDKKLEELHFYKSREYAAILQKRILTELPYTEGYSWQCEIPIDVDSKKAGVTARVFVFPDIVADDTNITTLLISAVIHKHLLEKLKEGCEDCWVVVETEVMDRRAGRRLDFKECSPHKIDVKNGRVNFYQNLLSCKKVLRTESESVDLMLKVTFITSPRQEGYDDEYVVIQDT